MNIDFTVIGLSQLEIKFKSTAPEVDALTLRHLRCNSVNFYSNKALVCHKTLCFESITVWFLCSIT